MSRYVFIPGAGGAAWYWSRVVPLLEAAGHEAVAIGLPADDDSAGLPEYADLVAQACAGQDDIVLVAQSLGGFTAPLVAERTPVRTLVFVNAMIPEPGETAEAWGDDVDASKARIAAAEAGGYSTEFDLDTYFFHDVPPEIAAEGEAHQRDESNSAFQGACTFTSLPATVRVLAGADDRLFPVEFQQRVARDRLGIDADVLPGGHLMALSNPTGVADYLNRVGASA
jgi:pimeloyl-ACP methyl ester carboxylesterase